MKHALYQFCAGSSELELTGKELIITTAASQEKLALKAIKYIRVSDQAAEYQEAINIWERKRTANKWFLAFGTLILLPGIAGFFIHPGLGFVASTFAMAFIIPSTLALRALKTDKPVSFSVLKIKTALEERHFPLAQNTYSRVNLAAFVTHVERALSQVHNAATDDLQTFNFQKL